MVEGAFGNLKNSQTEDVRRGNSRSRGLGRLTFDGLAWTLAYNIRMARNFQQKHGTLDPTHPLLTPDPEIFGYIEITQAQLDASKGTIEEAA